MRLLVCAAAIVVLLTGSQTWADKAEEPVQFPSNMAIYLGPYIGAHIPLRTWDLGVHEKLGENDLGASSLIGLRFGVQFISQFALEAELAGLPTKSSSGERLTVLNYNIDVLVHLLPGRWTPVLEGGVGGYTRSISDFSSDSAPRAHLGAGFRGMLTNWLAFRIDCRDVFSDGQGKKDSNNLEVSAGLDFFAWRGQEAPGDRDGDGVADDKDACPDKAGSQEANGCPDADHDGIQDSEDQCPKQAGPAKTKGCPDTDGDGVIDSEDRCPKQAGPAKTKGCPDADGDGISDAEDRCPKQPGPAKTKGCPDTDGDGVLDAKDRCPRQPGPIALEGCPDKDGDAVPDIDDKCPDVKGVKENQGCMPEALKKFTGAMKGVTFALGSAKILKPSHKILDETVAILKEYPTLKLAIEGHTDTVGKPEKNQKLSEDRANSVRDYLVSKGVEESRVSAIGYGGSKPVQNNKTAKGRAANRRIEFKVTAD